MAYKRANSELGTAPKTCLRSSFALRPHTSHWATSTEGLANPEPTSIYHPGHALLLAGSTGGQHKAKRNKTAPPSHRKPQTTPLWEGSRPQRGSHHEQLRQTRCNGTATHQEKNRTGLFRRKQGYGLTAGSHLQFTWKRWICTFLATHVCPVLVPARAAGSE